MFKQCQQHLCRFSLSTLPHSPGASPSLFSRSRLSLSLSLSLLYFSLSLFFLLSSLPPSVPPFLQDIPLFFFSSILLSFHSYNPVSLTLIRNIPPLSLSILPLSCSLLFFLFLFSLGVMYMCNYYYVVVIHATLRHVQTRLVRVGKMVVFEYNMYPVYPTG